jgi:hypothetical protein
MSQRRFAVAISRVVSITTEKTALPKAGFRDLMAFDHVKYLERNPDVATSLKSTNEDTSAGAREHFKRSGYAEGRSWS